MKFLLIVLGTVFLIGCKEPEGPMSDRNIGNIISILENHSLSQQDILKIDLDKIVNGKTYLMLAVEEENKEWTRLLLKHGASPNVQNKNGTSAMHIAMWSQDPSFIKLLLDNEGDSNLFNKKEKKSLVFSAIMPERLEHLKLLIKYGAEVNVQDSMKQTPLMLAANSSQYDMVFLLLNAGADPTVEDNWGHTIQSSLKLDDLPENSNMNVWKQKVIDFVSNDK